MSQYDRKFTLKGVREPECVEVPQHRRRSKIGIATRYGLDDPGIESRWRLDYPQPSTPTLGSTQLPIQWVPRRSPLKRPGRDVDYPPPHSAEVKERVIPSGPS